MTAGDEFPCDGCAEGCDASDGAYCVEYQLWLEGHSWEWEVPDDE